MPILSAFLVITLLALALGFGLAVADKKLKIEKDPRLEELESIMPGANCGGCGFAGCAAYAEAVYSKTAEPGHCAPGGAALARRMGEIMGVSVADVKEKVAYVHCNAHCEDKVKAYDYQGITDCNAASILFKGDNVCKYGCLGCLSCAAICPEAAISKSSEGIVSVDPDKCIGCAKCIKACPNGVISLIDKDSPYAIGCNSKDKGPSVTKACSKGCIGCRICEVKFPESGIKIVDNLPIFNPSEPHGQIAEAAAKCPKGVILKR